MLSSAVFPYTGAFSLGRHKGKESAIHTWEHGDLQHWEGVLSLLYTGAVESTLKLARKQPC